MYKETLPWVQNLDESEIPPYVLPDLMTCQDGTPVTTPECWMNKRRPELLQLFKDYMYGELPPLPDKVQAEQVSEKEVFEGLAIRREVKLTFSMNNGKSHSVIMLYYFPKNATPAPVFVGLTFGGNHVLTFDEDVQITGWAFNPEKQAMERGEQVRRFPLEFILRRGYALATASYHDFMPDRPNSWKEGILHLFHDDSECEPRLKGTSSICAWSWGISRMLDYLETVPEINAKKCACYGHSRLGKTSLWTGANDTRFSLVCVNDSGCGGAALSRRLYGETLFSMCRKNNIGLLWFNEVLETFVEEPGKLPMDQHELIALVAPRRVAVHSATLDQWADPKSEYLSTYYAGPAFALLGKTPLASEIPPPPDTPVGTDVSYFYRTGKHDILLSDWEQYVKAFDGIK